MDRHLTTKAFSDHGLWPNFALHLPGFLATQDDLPPIPEATFWLYQGPSWPLVDQGGRWCIILLILLDCWLDGIPYSGVRDILSPPGRPFTACWELKYVSDSSITCRILKHFWRSLIEYMNSIYKRISVKATRFAGLAQYQ